MPRFQREIVINRPAEEVFDFVTEARNEPRYNPRIVNVEKRTPGPVGRGTHFVLVSNAMGQLGMDQVPACIGLDGDYSRRVRPGEGATGREPHPQPEGGRQVGYR